MTLKTAHTLTVGDFLIDFDARVTSVDPTDQGVWIELNDGDQFHSGRSTAYRVAVEDKCA